ncbi:protein MOTHER of FT and TFL1-like [Pistacia vera]|uniref:protein MOTHER of FT and TFL1-like n=1 Tax=Pistacia vera TaxID=55513 RepID=UPI001262F737|nr:protein MOTHER of FT and TFL1-like [Pistacia vera]
MSIHVFLNYANTKYYSNICPSPQHFPNDRYNTTINSLFPWARGTRKEILPYVGPRPPVGIHRFIMVLFQQKAPLGAVEQPASRANFNTRLFARHLDLGLPVATIYFNSQKEPASRRR